MATESKRRIFIIDDEPIQNEMLKDYLSERFLYDIIAFDNGEDALKKMDQHPDIVILDYHLSANKAGARNGVEILKSIKETYPGTEVVMFSGQDKIDVAIDSMKYGAYDYVVKGETAFSRMENVINKVSELHNLKLINKGYKRTIALLCVVVAISIILAFSLPHFFH